MQNYVINGFRKCGLFPLNPDSVDYPKCLRNTLEEQSVRFSEETSLEAITLSHIRTAEKVLEKIRDPLVNYGIDVDVIFEELKLLSSSFAPFSMERNAELEECNFLTSDDNEEIAIGSIISIDELTIVPLDDIVVAVDNYTIMSELDNTLITTTPLPQQISKTFSTPDKADDTPCQQNRTKKDENYKIY